MRTPILGGTTDLERLVDARDLNGLTELLARKLEANGSGWPNERPLSASERAALTAGGLVLEETDIGQNEDPVVLGIRRLAEVLIDSLSHRDVAKKLQLSQDQVRSMIERHELYRVGSEMGLERFPAFQFAENELLPGFQDVARAIPADHSAVGIAEFFHAMNPDLYVDEDIDRPLSPLEWLRRGLDPTAVVRQLENL